MIDISIEMEKYQKHAAVMQSREEKNPKTLLPN